MAAWNDLGSRMASGAVMAAVGVAMIWLGGPWFAGLTAMVCGVMLWELSRMVAPDQPNAALQLGVLAVGAMMLARLGGAMWVVPLIGAVAISGAAILRATPVHRVLFVLFAVAILGAGTGLAWFRDAYGIVWLVWLVLVVIATDVFGYFAGRLIGGPKFWPAISPKKTWSGTVAGWVAAALLGVIFRQFTNAGPDLPWISVALSMASQAGDMAESALKRRTGVKDSSSLIPGHGGLFDRFDGLLAAALFMLLVSQLVYVPEVRF